MKYLFMAIAIIFSVVNACLLRSLAYKTAGNKYSAFAFNSGVSLVWTIILAIWFVISSDNAISGTAVIYGIIYGIILGLFLLFKTRATAEGPVSLTTLIASCAFIIATVFGVIYAGESVNMFQIIGMVMLFVSLVLCVNPKKSGEKLTGKWFFNCFIFFFVGGLVGILYKLFGKSSASAQINSMMLIAAIVSGCFFLAASVIESKSKGVKIQRPNRTVILYMLFCGIAGCTYIRMNLSLSAVIPSAVFFPVSNGGMVILSTVAGKIFFKEKLKSIQIAGIIIGFIAIVITGCGETLWNYIC